MIHINKSFYVAFSYVGDIKPRIKGNIFRKQWMRIKVDLENHKKVIWTRYISF